jgi:hypothetical protein
MAAEAKEAVEDITAEAKSEIASSGQESAATDAKAKKASPKKEKSSEAS